jgi:hypothetical protein
MKPLLLAIGAILMMPGAPILSIAGEIPLIDTHIHYSHDAWRATPPAEAVKVLRSAGLKKAFVSSSSDEGTQKLVAEAPDLVVAVLRPYRRRGELSSWLKDETVIAHLEDRLARYQYAGIGEFHVFSEDAELPVFRKVVQLAMAYRLFLHAHSDEDAVRRIFVQAPEARVLWAHSGFSDPETIRQMLLAYPRLWCDLAFRSEHALNGKVDPQWRALFLDFPDRFMVGTDTFSPERWYYVVDHAQWSRKWLEDLPPEIARQIAYLNAEALLAARDR